MLFKQNKVDYIKGSASFISPKIISMQLNNGGESTVKAKNVIIMTGSEVAPFLKVPEKMVVISSEIIGLEMGSVWPKGDDDATNPGNNDDTT
ncbi:hypothetical protein EDB86DRAFT_3093361 [Lactarius hatsudake]|nr:hypothetical protein EDB86DRAFT_3093361 [Lactarius hatsudake]